MLLGENYEVISMTFLMRSCSWHRTGLRASRAFSTFQPSADVSSLRVLRGPARIQNPCITNVMAYQYLGELTDIPSSETKTSESFLSKRPIGRDFSMGEFVMPEQ